MTTKTEEKAPPRQQPPVGPTPQQLEAAHKCHTLAQILYRQLAVSHPWIVPAPYAHGMPPTPGYAPLP